MVNSGKDINELIQEAYYASGYRSTSDSIVVNDRYRALLQLSENELLNIINNPYETTTKIKRGN